MSSVRPRCPRRARVASPPPPTAGPPARSSESSASIRTASARALAGSWRAIRFRQRRVPSRDPASARLAPRKRGPAPRGVERAQPTPRAFTASADGGSPSPVIMTSGDSPIGQRRPIGVRDDVREVAARDGRADARAPPLRRTNPDPIRAVPIRKAEGRPRRAATRPPGLAQGGTPIVIIQVVVAARAGSASRGAHRHRAFDSTGIGCRRGSVTLVASSNAVAVTLTCGDNLFDSNANSFTAKYTATSATLTLSYLTAGGGGTWVQTFAKQ